jgi:hypothetical protein
VALGEGRNSEPASLPVRRSGPYHVEQQAAERASPAISEEGGQVVEIAGRLPSGRCGEKIKITFRCRAQHQPDNLIR